MWQWRKRSPVSDTLCKELLPRGGAGLTKTPLRCVLRDTTWRGTVSQSTHFPSPQYSIGLFSPRNLFNWHRPTQTSRTRIDKGRASQTNNPQKGPSFFWKLALMSKFFFAFIFHTFGLGSYSWRELKQRGLPIFIACPKSVFPENGIKKIFWLFWRKSPRFSIWKNWQLCRQKRYPKKK